MRVENWNPTKFDSHFEKVSMNRLKEAAQVVEKSAKKTVKVGTISRPIYQSGPYAGQTWTKRDAGSLKKSIRVVRKRTKSGKALSRKRNIRVYAGNYFAYYAAIVEYKDSYLRSALWKNLSKIRSIIGTSG